MALAEKLGRLIILDPSLEGAHCQRYVMSSCIAKRAKESGYEVIVFANSSFDTSQNIAGAKVRPVFSLTTHDYFKSIEEGGKATLSQSLKNVVRTYFPALFVRFLKRLRNKLEISLSRAGIPFTLIPDLSSSGIDVELRTAMLKDGVVSHDHIIVHTSDAIMYRTILKLLLKVYPLGKFPCFHMCTPYGAHDMPFAAKGLSIDRVISYLQMMGFLNRYIFLYAGGEKLVHSLSRDWGVNVTDLGILPDLADDNILPEHFLKSGYLTFADRLLVKVSEINKMSALEEGVKRSLSSAGNVRNAHDRGREEAHVNHDDVRIKSGYNGGLCEAVLSDDNHPLFVKQIIP